MNKAHENSSEFIEQLLGSAQLAGSIAATNPNLFWELVNQMIDEYNHEKDPETSESDKILIDELSSESDELSSESDELLSESDELLSESDELLSDDFSDVSDITIPETQEEVNAMDPDTIVSLMMPPANIQLTEFTTPKGTTLVMREMKGQGSLGTVFKANVLGSGETVAVKVIDFDVVNPGEEDYNQFLLSRFAQARRQSFHQAAAAWKVAAGLLEPNHPSLAFVESFIDGSRGVLVMPYIDNAIPLCDVDFNKMSLEDARTLRDRLVKVVERFHTSGMIHGNLESENILINVNLLEPHIIDLGQAIEATRPVRDFETLEAVLLLDIMLQRKAEGLPV